MPAKRAAKRSKAALSGRVASVSVERNGATICVEDVNGEEAGDVLVAILDVFRVMQRENPEVIPTLEAIHGGPATDVRDEEDWESREKRVGF